MRFTNSAQSIPFPVACATNNRTMQCAVMGRVIGIIGARKPPQRWRSAARLFMGRPILQSGRASRARPVWRGTPALFPSRAGYALLARQLTSGTPMASAVLGVCNLNSFDLRLPSASREFRHPCARRHPRCHPADIPARRRCCSAGFLRWRVAAPEPSF